MSRLFAILFLILYGTPSFAQNYLPDWSSLDQRATPEWWLDAKFGIFIHWGVYSVPAFTAKGNYAEWYQHSLENNAHEGKVRDFHLKNYGNRNYYDLAADFHAELFEPDEWARLFEKAGARYVVLTSKHHDGFCLWPSVYADRTWGFPWNAVSTGPKRDLVGDLFAALQKTQVKPGLYFSLYEWFNPLWRFDHRRYASDHAMPQLYELVNRYQPWVVWADGDWDDTPDTWQSPKFLAWLYNQSAMRDQVVVNDRWGSGVRFKHGGVYTPEYQPDLDFEDHAWEESRGMGFSYGYNRMEDASDYNSAQTLLLHLIDKVSRGGNFLLDIGPDSHGKIPPIMQERLLEIGKWLEINGEAIYGDPSVAYTLPMERREARV
ncbi:MAG: alpha-L-fucosidase [Saprospirales bacterium]|nr:alpha-L-fucosidase [Saprospirales bacterium]